MTSTSKGQSPGAGFDQYADDYDQLLEKSLAISGESKEYFARQRVRHLARALRSRGAPAESVLDYGCGTGTATPYLIEELGAARTVGVDPSERSLTVARRQFGSDRSSFQLLDTSPPNASFDVAYVSGVFHHIPRDQRLAAARYVHASLRPGGYFSFWEHNPWNPGTRYSMWRCPFDADAEMLWPGAARRLLREAGFEVLGTRFWFVFPRVLRIFRPTERLTSVLPLGAQYHVLCRRLALVS